MIRNLRGTISALSARAAPCQLVNVQDPQIAGRGLRSRVRARGELIL